MKQLRLFFATLSLTAVAFFPAAVLADDDLEDLEGVTMTVLDDVSELEDSISEMRGPDDDGVDKEDWEDHGESDEESDRARDEQLAREEEEQERREREEEELDDEADSDGDLEEDVENDEDSDSDEFEEDRDFEEDVMEGEDDFEGLMFHPQLWPEDLDYLDEHPGMKMRFRLIRDGRVKYLLEMTPTVVHYEIFGAGDV